MRALLTVLFGLAGTVAAAARPAIITVAPPHAGTRDYGPADMLCNLNSCRLFSLPGSNGLPGGTIVEFGMPALDGQDRIALRRCLVLCRASVTAYEVPANGDDHQPKGVIAVVPVELRLE